jgi:hypothetical protein
MGFLWDFIANLAAAVAFETLTPLGMTGIAIAVLVTVAWVIGWHHRQRAAKKPGMASWYFIALCFVVAILTIGAGVYGIALREMGKLPAQATMGHQEIDLHTGNKITPTPVPLSPKPERRYSSADVPKLTPIVQRISELLTEEGKPLEFQIYNFCMTIQQKLNDLGPKETVRQLQAFADRANKLGAEIDAIQSGAGYYQDEVNYIIDAKSGNVVQGVAQEIKNSTRWLTGIAMPLNQAGFEIIQNMSAPLQSKARDFDKWTTETPKRVQEIRKELDAAR